MRSSLPLELWGDLSVYARDVEPARFSIQLALKNDEVTQIIFSVPNHSVCVPDLSTDSPAGSWAAILRANATITWVPARR